MWKVVILRQGSISVPQAPCTAQGPHIFTIYKPPPVGVGGKAGGSSSFGPDEEGSGVNKDLRRFAPKLRRAGNGDSSRHNGLISKAQA